MSDERHTSHDILELYSKVGGGAGKGRAASWSAEGETQQSDHRESVRCAIRMRQERGPRPQLLAGSLGQLSSDTPVGRSLDLGEVRALWVVRPGYVSPDCSGFQKREPADLEICVDEYVACLCVICMQFSCVFCNFLSIRKR